MKRNVKLNRPVGVLLVYMRAAAAASCTVVIAAGFGTTYVDPWVGHGIELAPEEVNYPWMPTLGVGQWVGLAGSEEG